jgi:hypothetical protein
MLDESKKTKGAAPDQENAPLEFTNFSANDTASSLGSTTVDDVLASKSTTTEIQLAKLLALLRSGPKTTIQLRDHGIMMPAARVHYLRHVDGHQITSQLVTLFDANGFRHAKCARYYLEGEAPAKEAA